jgi:hypothetical protein
MKFNDLVGLTFTSVTRGQSDHEYTGGEAIKFVCSDGRKFELFHYQDCCESVYIESIVGELSDLENTPITFADESSGANVIPEEDDYGDISGWTFYKLATVKGWVDIRWVGSSNGYYSIGVDFEEINDN